MLGCIYRNCHSDPVVAIKMSKMTRTSQDGPHVKRFFSCVLEWEMVKARGWCVCSFGSRIKTLGYLCAYVGRILKFARVFIPRRCSALRAMD